MIDKSFKINISTPAGTVYDGKILSLIAPGEMGYFGILMDHAPLIANLVPGRIIIKETPEEPKIFNSTGKGIIEVLENHVSILVDSVEKS